MREKGPPCKCHNEPMIWHTRRNRKNGGNWECAVKGRERCSQWRENNPERKREYKQKYTKLAREKGFCISCYKREAREDKTTCQFCADRQKTNQESERGRFTHYVAARRYARRKLLRESEAKLNSLKTKRGEVLETTNRT